MLKKLGMIGALSMMLFSTSCATVVSKSKWPLTIESAPTNSKIVITNKKGNEVFTGQTPTTVDLKSSRGFFSKEKYEVTFSKEGYESKVVPVKFKLNGWYFGNIFVGGIIGFLIVDPATGAMFRLKENFINETLVNISENSEQSNGLTIYSIDEIPSEWKDHLVKIK